MCDKHIVKMILESAQLLSTCHRVQDGTEYYDKTANGRKIKGGNDPNPNLEPLLYKAGWVKHPSTIWLFESAYNYIWLYKHMIALNDEYKKRYNHTKNHVTIDKLGEILKHPPKNAKYNKIATEPKPANAEYCKMMVKLAVTEKYYIMEKGVKIWQRRRRKSHKNTRMVHRW